MRHPRQIIANLDAENDMAALLSGAPRQALAQRVLATISGLGTLLRVFANDSDVLRTPIPVDPQRVVDVPGLPRPGLKHGQCSNRSTTARSAMLAWAETRNIANARGPRLETPKTSSLDVPLHELVWQLPAPSSETAARVNHRGFAFELGQHLGVNLPNATLVNDIEALQKILSQTPESDSSWVLKAPLSAAGRDRFIFSTATWDQRRAARLFQRFGPLMLEPWVQRTDDFGVVGLIAENAYRVLGVHGQRVDAAGRFQGIEIPAPGLRDEEHTVFQRVANETAAALAAAGYRGLFSIDAFRYMDNGTERFHPLCEINARISFGAVARALLERLGFTGGVLQLGRHEAQDSVILLAPDDQGIMASLRPMSAPTGPSDGF